MSVPRRLTKNVGHRKAVLETTGSSRRRSLDPRWATSTRNEPCKTRKYTTMPGQIGDRGTRRTITGQPRSLDRVQSTGR